MTLPACPQQASLAPAEGQRYHLSLSGEPKPCTAAPGNCPLSDGDEHYPSPEAARAAYEEENREFVIAPPLKRGELTRKQAIELDQFFTKDEVAQECLAEAKPLLEALGYDLSKVHFLEPSAGGGSFVRAAGAAFPGRPVAQGDLQPKSEAVYQADFLRDDITPLLQGEREHRVIIGNPPFGYKGQLAADFINKGLEHADTVVFVIPVQFQKWSAQRLVDGEARLVHDRTLPMDSFTVNGSSYGVRCCFQVWTKRPAEAVAPEAAGERQEEGVRTTLAGNQRKLSRPPADHEDLDLWVVSSKPESKRHIQEAEWDYAVVCQGYKGDYERVELIPKADAHKLSMKKHYLLFRGKSPQAAERMKHLDFKKLAEGATTATMGFSRADVVEAYSRSKKLAEAS